MFHSKRHFISLISFAALMIPLNCPVQAFHNRCLLWGDKTYDSELVSELSLVISCTYLLPKQCFAQIRCLIHVELKKKKVVGKLTEEQIMCSAFNLNRR